MTGASALDSVVQPRESSNMAESVNFESDHESQHEMDESSEDEEQIDESPLEKAARAGANLSTPRKADIARKQKIQSNPAGKNRSTRGSKDPPKVTAWDRVQKYKEEYFCVMQGKLRCNACKEVLSKKESTIKHIKSNKHEKAKKQLQAEKLKDQSIAKLLKANNSKTNPKGETLPEEMRVYRFDLVENCLAAGVPLAKVDSPRSFLEKYGHRITSHSHLSEMIPAVLAKEKETLKSELSGANSFSVIFDGSTRLGEALAIIVRYIDGNWNLEQRLVSFQTLAKSLKNDELAKCLLECLAINYSIKPTGLLAAMKDGAAVNEATIRQIQFYFPQAFSVTCFSHTIDNVGKHFEFRGLDKFIMYWTAMFSNSPAVRLAWKDRTGKAMRSHSKTRWWSQFEIMKQVFEYYGDVEPFLRENDHLAPATRGHLLELFNNQNDATDLKLELAALIDGGVHFVTGTYNLEGD